MVQVNTGAGCHLDAEMVRGRSTRSTPNAGTLLFIENVGNLVCPALFDLGERGKVVVISVTEGDDKPLKYPHMFAAADLVLVNKTDLLPYVDFDLDQCARHDADRCNPDVAGPAHVGTTGDGMDGWYQWIDARARPGGPPAVDSGHPGRALDREERHASGPRVDSGDVGARSPAPESAAACLQKRQSKPKKL